MPDIGDVVRGRDIGRHSCGGSIKYIWSACIDCGKERWVDFSRREYRCIRCKPCSDKIRGKTYSEKYNGNKHPLWQGGHHDKNGYILIKLSKDDFFRAMCDSEGRVREHRLIMAKHLGRCLHRWEIVHHLNGIKDDNREENLQLVTDDRHNQITQLENRIKLLEARVISLEAENILLKTPARQMA